MSVLQGGFGILEEMCVNYVHYYPQTQLELCKSAVDPGYLHRYFNLVNRYRALHGGAGWRGTIAEPFASNAGKKQLIKWGQCMAKCLHAKYFLYPGANTKHPCSSFTHHERAEMLTLHTMSYLWTVRLAPNLAPQVLALLVSPSSHC